MANIRKRCGGTTKQTKHVKEKETRSNKVENINQKDGRKRDKEKERE